MRRFTPLLFAFAFACGGTTEPADIDPNTNVTPDPNGEKNGELEIGKGATAFEVLADDEEIEVVMAPQTNGGLGLGQHIDFAIRAKGIEPMGARVHLVLFDDAATYAESTQALNLVADGDWWITAGLRAVLDSCGDIADKPLTITIDVKDTNDVQVMATKPIRGPFACPRQPG
ncbi:MAG: hypothetical protein RIT81_33765 [Deltaproteobacteria bacterium]